MNPSGRRDPISNPFSTRWVRPGALPYLFPAGCDAAQLVDRLVSQGWWGEIIGPHGSGKSTLLATMLPELTARGREPVLFTLHDGQRSLPGGSSALRQLGPKSVVIVDGYEQLGFWSRFRLRRLCRRQSCGLVITAHRPQGLPSLFETQSDLATAQVLIERLVPREEFAIEREELARILRSHQGNLREALFELYDRYEQCRARTGMVPKCADRGR